MKPPTPWEPKPLLDDHPWSLLPNLGLPRFIELAAILVWLGLVVVVAIHQSHPALRVVVTAILGTWAVHYLCARLGGRTALIGGAANPIRPDSAFQARLAFDIMSILVLGTAGYSLFRS